MYIEIRFLTKFRELLRITDRDLQLEENFRDYDEWNSLVFISLIDMIDEEFDVIIEGKNFKQLNTNLDIVKAIKSSILN